MKRKSFILMAAVAALGALILPASASAAVSADAVVQYNLNSLWLTIAAVLVIFMQAGFAFLEIGFSRGKNVGTVVAKILTNMAIAGLFYWIIGYSLSFSNGTAETAPGFSGNFDNLFLSNIGVGGMQTASDDAVYSEWSFWIFQYAFLAVSLAIVWGTTLERIKFSTYIIYGAIFSAFIYPIVAHWSWGGGWLAQQGVQDFAGSGVVHLCGATAGLAATIVLGARKGKYVDGKPQAIPGHSMPWFGLACIILLVGWFGFNPGSELAADNRVAEIAVVTLAGGLFGILGAFITSYLVQKTIDIGMVGNGLIAGLVAITAPSGYVIVWPAVVIGLVAGVIVVLGVLLFDKLKIDDPVGALSAHGLAGIWGVLACGIFTFPAFVLDGQKEGLWYGGGLHQLGVQALATVATFAFVFLISLIVFYAIKATIGMRVSEAEEDAGLDISEHGMYGYPEQFIPPSELIGSGMPGTPSHASSVLPTSTPVEA
ncbi:MAG: ammonium transporter [Solirubrobacterales bacterium]